MRIEELIYVKKFEGILITTDLDGTLLNDEHIIPKENLDAIEYFKENGGYFTFITGRPTVIIGDLYNTVKIAIARTRSIHSTLFLPIWFSP